MGGANDGTFIIWKDGIEESIISISLSEYKFIANGFCSEKVEIIILEFWNILLGMLVYTILKVV